MKRRKIIVIVVSVLFLVFAGKLVFDTVSDVEKGGHKEEQTETKKTEQVQKTEEKTEVEYENLEGLYFLNKAGWLEIQESLETWCNKEGVKLRYVRVHPVVEEKLPVWIFYLELNHGEEYVKGTYEEGVMDYEFINALPEPETVTEENVPEKELDEQKEGALASYDPDIDNPELGEVTIQNVAELPVGVDEKELTLVVEKKFLSAGEYRRELVYEKEYQTEQHHWLWFSFVNPRSDGKDVRVSVKENGSFLVFIRAMEMEDTK